MPLCCAARLGARCCCWVPWPRTLSAALCLVRHTRTLAAPSTAAPQVVSAPPPHTRPAAPAHCRQDGGAAAHAAQASARVCAWGVRSPRMAAGRSTLRLRASVLRGAPLGAAASAAVYLAAALVSRAPRRALRHGATGRECTTAAPYSLPPRPLSSAAREPARLSWGAAAGRVAWRQRVQHRPARAWAMARGASACTRVGA